MAQRPIIERQSGFQAAIDGITDGLSRLVRNHFELARTEVRREASAVGQHLGALAVFASIALVGYGLLNLAIILFAAWLGDIAIMAIVALVLAILNLGVAGFAIARIVARLKDSDVGLAQTTEELQKDKQWLKEIRDNSSPELPAKTH